MHQARFFSLCCLFFASIWGPMQSAQAAGTGEFADFRALWVSRFEYSTSNPASVQQIVANAASIGITDLIFQVRGKADAYYNSNLEPRAERLSGSWDPLQTAIDAAHANGIKLHAWINTMPIWRDTAAPTDPNHIFFNTNPSFRVSDINGVVQDPVALGGVYASVNPILPEVRDHVDNVVTDIINNYDVDGVHLDFIRWLGDTSFDNLPHDNQSHQIFQQETGLDGSNPSNATAYTNFVRDKITEMVSSIRDASTAADPSVKLSAALWRDPDIAFNERLQDYRTWLENDLLDIAMPMIYLSASNNNLFVPNLSNTMNIPTNALIAPGIGAFLHDDPALTVSQLSSAFNLGANGSTIFSYSSLFNNGQLGVDIRNAVKDFIDSTATPTPPPPGGGLIVALVDFEADEGTFASPPTFSGSNRGIISGTADRDTTQAYEGAASQRINIVGEATGWTLRHVSGVGDPGNNVSIAADGWIGFWLMTTDIGLSVQIALDDPLSADRGTLKPLPADGLWHLYQWDLDDPAQWEAWVNGNGIIDGPTLTLDSIFFHGAGNATVFLDMVAFNNGGSLIPTIAGDLDGNGFVDILDLNIVLANWNTDGSADPRADTDGNGLIDIIDLNVVLTDWNQGTPPLSGADSAVPEPGTLIVFAASICGLLRRRR